MKIIMDRVYILWIDSESPASGSWVGADDMEHHAKAPATVETIGFLYKDADDFVTVVSSIASSPCFQGIMTIPKVAIKEIIRYDENMEIKNGTNES